MICLNMSDQLSIKDRFIYFYLKNKYLFDSFEHVYLFGSIIKDKDFPNDIDLLLVYSKYSERLLFEKNQICSLIEYALDISVDITMLSVYELHDTIFLDRIVKYYQLK